jgi:hypothetical protein
VHVVAIVAIIGANPLETIEILFHSLNEVLTGEDSVGDLARLSTRVGVDVDVG